MIQQDLTVPDWFIPLCELASQGLINRAMFTIAELMLTSQSEGMKLACAKEILDRGGVGAQYKQPQVAMAQQFNFVAPGQLAGSLPKGDPDILAALRNLAAKQQALHNGGKGGGSEQTSAVEDTD